MFSTDPNSFIPRGGQMPAPGSFRPQMGQQQYRPAGLGGSMPQRQAPPPRAMPWDRGLRDPGVSPNVNQQGIQNAIAKQQQMGGGVRPGMNMMGGPSVGGPQGPNLDQIRNEMARRQVGAQLGPQNAALSGYMMGK